MLQMPFRGCLISIRKRERLQTFAKELLLATI